MRSAPCASPSVPGPVAGAEARRHSEQRQLHRLARAQRGRHRIGPLHVLHASGEVGVVMVTSGPGATNTVTPVRDCMADSIPIVVICGQVPTNAIGTDAFQEAPGAAIMGAIAKHVFLVTDPTSLESTLRTAFEIARTGRPGPVVIDIPKDVQNWEGEFTGAGFLPIQGYRARLQSVLENRLTDDASKRSFKT